MSRTSLWVSLGFGLLLTGSGCDGTFANVGTDAGGNSQGGTNANGGATSPQGGTTAAGGTTTCVVVPLAMPQCTNGTAVLQYDASGCPTHYACPGDTGSCQCTGTHPMIANILCSDGSTGGPVCAADATGSCSWIIRTCPPNSGTGGSTGAGGAATGSGGSSGSTCTYNGVTYAAGVSFKDADGCNTCSCSSTGQVMCTMMACVAQGGSSSGVGGATSVGGGTSVAGTTGSGGCSNAIPMLMPVCTNGTAVMQYDASGCPIGYGCSDTVCKCTGPTMGAPNYVCADGTTGGPVCAVKTDGSCSWMLRSCPTTA